MLSPRSAALVALLVAAPALAGAALVGVPGLAPVLPAEPAAQGPGKAAPPRERGPALETLEALQTPIILGPEQPAEPGGEPGAELAAVSFLPRVEVDPARTGGEPGIDIDPAGCVYINAIGVRSLWRSCDGLTFGRLNPPVFSINGLDSELAIDSEGTLFYNDLWLGSASISASRNQGASWTRNNPVSLLPPVNDRQWLVDLGPGRVLLTTNQIPSGLTVTHCLLAPQDALVACAPTALVAPDALRFCVCPPGQPAASPDGKLVVLPYMSIRNDPNPGFNVLDPDSEPITTDLVVDAAFSKDGGLTWTTKTVAKAAGAPSIFPVAAYDAAGHAYVAWAARRPGDAAFEVWMARSLDGGETWDPKPLRISAGGTNVLPWIAAGAEGRVALAWYHTDTVGNPETLKGTWQVAFAESSNAHTAAPTLQRGLASPAIVHKDDLCISGLNCNADRDLLDFLAIALDAQGKAHIAFADDETDGHDGHAHVYYVRQA